MKTYPFPTLCRGSGYERRSTNSALWYFISKITLQQQKILNKTFYHFWWLAPENSKNHFVTQKLVKNQEPDIYYEIESKVKYWFRVSMWLSKQNYIRISRNPSVKYKYIADVIKCWYQQESNDMLPNYHFSLFKKKALQELPLDASATFLSLVVQGFWNFVWENQFHLMSAKNWLHRQKYCHQPCFNKVTALPRFYLEVNLHPFKKPHLNNFSWFAHSG